MEESSTASAYRLRTTFFGAENSEVLAPGAVAVMFCPLATLAAGLNEKGVLPEVSVLTIFSPMKVLPSSVPEGLEKNWTRKGVLGVLFSLPPMVVSFLPVLA